MSKKINWAMIDQVFLDMDGTLLDLHFDSYFWLEHVPQRYAEDNGLSFSEARQQLLSRYKEIEGTLEWYCVDHWSRELGLDIALLKEEIEHLIGVHPHVVDFLEQLGRLGKRRVLITNAHQKSLALKMRKTSLDHHFDDIISAHEIGFPKESGVFWSRLHARHPFDPDRTLFVDDSPSVLHSAKKYGIRYLLGILKPDTQEPANSLPDFDGITDFSELLPLVK